MTKTTEYPWCKHGINKTGYCADCKVTSLITTIESQEEQIEAYRKGLKSIDEIMEMQRLMLESQKEEIGRMQAVNQHLEIDLAELKAVLISLLPNVRGLELTITSSLYPQSDKQKKIPLPELDGKVWNEFPEAKP